MIAALRVIFSPFVLVFLTATLTVGASAQMQSKSPALIEAEQVARTGDTVRAVKILTDAGEVGDFEAQVVLGMTYTGHGAPLAPADIGEAYFWMQKAAAQKPKAAAINLDQHLLAVGGALREGKIAPSVADNHYAEALKWFELALSPNRQAALVAIGELYEKGGHGITRDFGAADEYFERAYKVAPNSEFAFQVGSLRAQFDSAGRNDEVAALWLERAADDYVDAELWLAKYYVRLRKLRVATYWIDRFHLRQNVSDEHSQTFDELLKKYYQAMLPPAPSGWLLGAKIFHETSAEPAAPSAGSVNEFRYKIKFGGVYLRPDPEAPDTGVQRVDLMVFLNHPDRAAKAKEYLGHVRDELDAREKNKKSMRIKELSETPEWQILTGTNSKNNSGKRAANELDFIYHHESLSASLRIGGYDAYVDRQGAPEATPSSGASYLMQIPINTHIVVSASTPEFAGEGYDQGALRLMEILGGANFQQIIEISDGHGHYKKDANGKIYKP